MRHRRRGAAHRRWVRGGFGCPSRHRVAGDLRVSLDASLRSRTIDNLAYPPVFIPSPPTFNNFVQVFEQNSIGRYLWNSIVVSGGATLIALLVGVPAGYGIARTGAHRLTVLILIARMTPALSYLIPLFAVFQFLRLNNTLTALVITHLVITVPIIVYIMASHFEALPRARGSSEIDGAGVATFRRGAAHGARDRGGLHPVVHLLVEQLRVRRGAFGRETRTLPVAVYARSRSEKLAWVRSQRPQSSNTPSAAAHHHHQKKSSSA
jgi:multiple sugar transport system permease protein